MTTKTDKIMYRKDNFLELAKCESSSLKEEGGRFRFNATWYKFPPRARSAITAASDIFGERLMIFHLVVLAALSTATASAPAATDHDHPAPRAPGQPGGHRRRAEGGL